jgi:hypothetical protein
MEVFQHGPTRILRVQAMAETFSTVFDDWIARLFPRLNASTESHRILISHGNIFRCLTGSTCFFVSGTVEDDLLLLRQGGEFGLELIERNCPSELQLLKLRVVLVGADKKGCARFQPRINFFWANASRFCHARPLLRVARREQMANTFSELLFEWGHGLCKSSPVYEPQSYLS